MDQFNNTHPIDQFVTKRVPDGGEYLAHRKTLARRVMRDIGHSGWTMTVLTALAAAVTLAALLDAHQKPEAQTVHTRGSDLQRMDVPNCHSFDDAPTVQQIPFSTAPPLRGRAAGTLET